MLTIKFKQRTDRWTYYHPNGASIKVTSRNHIPIITCEKCGKTYTSFEKKGNWKEYDQEAAGMAWDLLISASRHRCPKLKGK